MCRSANQEGNGFAECEGFTQRDFVHGAWIGLASTNRGNFAGIGECRSVERRKGIADSRHCYFAARENLKGRTIFRAAVEYQSVETRLGDGCAKRPVWRRHTRVMFRGEEILQHHVVASAVDANDAG
jgi:hypothetical protein